MVIHVNRLFLVLSLGAVALAQQMGDPVRQVGVALGKIPGPGLRMLLTPSSGGPLSGRMERRVPAGSTLAVLDGQGRVASETAVDPKDGLFTLPALGVPLTGSLRACLRSPGAEPMCSEPGALQVLAGTAQPVRQGPMAGAGFSQGSPAKGSAAPLTAAEAALLAKVEIVKGRDGVWRCMSGRQVCSNTESQSYTVITKSRSNVKDNLMVAPDGTVHCRNAADGKPCSDAVFLGIVAQMKAITKGGQKGF